MAIFLPPTILATAAPPPPAYRYFRVNVTKIASVGEFAVLREMGLSSDGGSTWAPLGMTSNSDPAPLVASASSTNSTNAAYRAFDQTPSTFWVPSNLSTSGGVVSEWLQIDFGSGNSLAANRLRTMYYNTGGTNDTWTDFTLQGSNTGAFSGEQVTLLTVVGQGSQVDSTYIEYVLV